MRFPGRKHTGEQELVKRGQSRNGTGVVLALKSDQAVFSVPLVRQQSLNNKKNWRQALAQPMQ